MRSHPFIIAAIVLAPSGAAAADTQPICADRPSKSTGECTVAVGDWQVETGLVDWAHDNADGVSSDFTTFGSSLIKTGVSRRADIELGVTPLQALRIGGDGAGERHSGFGDVIARVKYRLTADDATAQAALDPFVKLPTASHRLGNGKVEGGMLIAMSVQLSKSGVALSLDPELDWTADADGDGHHLATQQVLNLGLPVNNKLSLSAELWGRWDWSQGDTGRQVSADGSVAYLVSDNLQFDAGANLGLNRQTPDVELYTGLSTRF